MRLYACKSGKKNSFGQKKVEGAFIDNFLNSRIKFVDFREGSEEVLNVRFEVLNNKVVLERPKNRGQVMLILHVIATYYELMLARNLKNGYIKGLKVYNTQGKEQKIPRPEIVFGKVSNTEIVFYLDHPIRGGIMEKRKYGSEFCMSHFYKFDRETHLPEVADFSDFNQGTDFLIYNYKCKSLHQLIQGYVNFLESKVPYILILKFGKEENYRPSILLSLENKVEVIYFLERKINKLNNSSLFSGYCPISALLRYFGVPTSEITSILPSNVIEEEYKYAKACLEGIMDAAEDTSISLTINKFLLKLKRRAKEIPPTLPMKKLEFKANKVREMLKNKSFFILPTVVYFFPKKMFLKFIRDLKRNNIYFSNYDGIVGLYDSRRALHLPTYYIPEKLRKEYGINYKLQSDSYGPNYNVYSCSQRKSKHFVKFAKLELLI